MIVVQRDDEVAQRHAVFLASCASANTSASGASLAAAGLHDMPPKVSGQGGDEVVVWVAPPQPTPTENATVAANNRIMRPTFA